MLRIAFLTQSFTLSSAAANATLIRTQAQRLAFNAAWPRLADSESSTSNPSSNGSSNGSQPQPENSSSSSSSSPFLPSSVTATFSSVVESTKTARPSSSVELPGSVLRDREQSDLSGSPGALLGVPSAVDGGRAPFYLHINVSNNNTILTLTNGNGNTLYACSGGSVGFKGAARSGYEAGYQAALNMFSTIQERYRTVWPNRQNGGRMFKLELIWKGFGKGREAVYRALLADEGSIARQYVSRMSDATKIKIGGARPKKRRNY